MTTNKGTMEKELIDNVGYVEALYLKERERRESGVFPEGLNVPNIFKDSNIDECSVFWGLSYSMHQIENVTKNKKSNVKMLTNLKDQKIKTINFDLSFDEKNDKLSDWDSTGIFRVDLSNGDFILIAQWTAGDGRETVADGILVGTPDSYSKLMKSLSLQEEVESNIKKGMFRLREKDGVPYYDKIKELQSTPVFHPSKDEAINDIDLFFSNIDEFTKEGKSGTRKSLWVGPPGTGKTSLSREILRDYGKKITACITTDIEACYAHMVKAAKNKKATIIVLEDGEKSLSDVNSEVLQVLDGVDLPRNPKGTYIIITTNKPRLIEKRILQRPGRIDAYSFFGVLKGGYALTCAKHYFKDSLYKGKSKENIEIIDKELLKIVSNEGKGMSGAQIQGLAESMISFANSRNKDVTTELIQEAKVEMKKNLTSIENMCKEEGLISADQMGFVLQSGEAKKIKSW